MDHVSKNIAEWRKQKMKRAEKKRKAKSYRASRNTLGNICPDVFRALLSA